MDLGKKRPPKLIVAAAAVIPVVAGFFTYLPALSGGFVWDDLNALRQSETIQSAYDVIVPPPSIAKIYYRPLVFLSYLADSSVVGMANPYWFHVASVALHLLNALLVFVLAGRWFSQDLIVRAGGALLFAVFPTHVESVAWISGRSDVLMTTFLLLAVILYLNDRRWSDWVGAASLLLAMLAKETAIAGLILLPLLDALERRHTNLSRLWPPIAVTALYFLLRRVGIGTFFGGLPQQESSLALGSDLLRALGFYFVQGVVPLSLQPYYAEVPQSPVYLMLGVLVPALLAATGLAIVRGRGESNARIVLACLVAWFFLTLAPTLSVIARRSALNLVADRYLYAPAVASCLVWAWAIRSVALRVGAQSAGAALAICTVALFFGAQTRAYVPVWADDVSLWTEAARKAPDAALPNQELANALLKKDDIDDAEVAFRAALASAPDAESRVMIYSNLGNLYRRKSQYARAVEVFRKGIAITPHPALFHNLGMTEMALAQRASMAGEKQLAITHVNQARDAFENALKTGAAPGTEEAFFQWEPAKTHALLGQVLFSLGDRGGAREHLEMALQLEPAGPVADITRQYMQRLDQ
jgi:tetratricopeptide (TPR) repeat protein